MARNQSIPPWLAGTLPVEWIGLTVYHWPELNEAVVVVNHVHQDGAEPNERVYQAIPLGPFYWRTPVADAIDLWVDQAGEALGWDLT